MTRNPHPSSRFYLVRGCVVHQADAVNSLQETARKATRAQCCPEDAPGLGQVTCGVPTAQEPQDPLSFLNTHLPSRSVSRPQPSLPRPALCRVMLLGGRGPGWGGTEPDAYAIPVPPLKWCPHNPHQPCLLFLAALTGPDKFDMDLFICSSSVSPYKCGTHGAGLPCWPASPAPGPPHVFCGMNGSPLPQG